MTDLQTVFATYVGLVPVVIGLTQIVKSFNIPNTIAPIFSMIFGYALVLVVGNSYLTVDFISAILPGILVGLSASGLYSGVKKYTEA